VCIYRCLSLFLSLSFCVCVVFDSKMNFVASRVIILCPRPNKASRVSHAVSCHNISRVELPTILCILTSSRLTHTHTQTHTHTATPTGIIIYAYAWTYPCALYSLSCPPFSPLSFLLCDVRFAC